jgi:hypothetical protein
MNELKIQSEIPTPQPQRLIDYISTLENGPTRELLQKILDDTAKFWAEKLGLDQEEIKKKLPLIPSFLLNNPEALRKISQTGRIVYMPGLEMPEFKSVVNLNAVSYGEEFDEMELHHQMVAEEMQDATTFATNIQKMYPGLLFNDETPGSLNYHPGYPSLAFWRALLRNEFPINQYPQKPSSSRRPQFEKGNWGVIEEVEKYQDQQRLFGEVPLTFDDRPLTKREGTFAGRAQFILSCQRSALLKSWGIPEAVRHVDIGLPRMLDLYLLSNPEMAKKKWWSGSHADSLDFFLDLRPDRKEEPFHETVETQQKLPNDVSFAALVLFYENERPDAAVRPFGRGDFSRALKNDVK